MTKHILVTGGAGYIGSQTCKALSQIGYIPVTFDNLSRGHREAVKWGPLEVGDVGDSARLDEVFERYKLQAVIHFAAVTYVGESVSEPLLYYQNNVAGTAVLAAAMQRHDVRHIVFSSSCAIYGIPETVPIAEGTPVAPISPYGATKSIVERMLRDCGSAFGLRSVSLRYFNAAGADRDGEIGEAHDPETHLIPLAIRAAMNQTSLDVLGTDYPTADGTAVRDYIHVGDLAAVHSAAVQYLFAGGETAAINVGTGKGASVLEIIKAVEDAGGQKIQWRACPRRAGDPAVLLADPSRLKTMLGLDPAKFAPLGEIVNSAWKWHNRMSDSAHR